jgi:formimidoylglutamate deiminase
LETKRVMQRLKQLWAEYAYLSINNEPPCWHTRVLLTIGISGQWQSIQTNHDKPLDAEQTQGPLLPSFVNGHSHAFQRSFAGLTESRQSGDHASDDFWSWRTRMYSVAQKITPPQQQAIAAQLYLELLQGGYTQVCEFHYLRRQPNGQNYAQPLAMSWALAQAAQQASIGLTILPVLYERAGFEHAGLRDDQQRFAQSAQETWDAAQAIAQAKMSLVNSGLAVHSLRAASAESISQLALLATDFQGPIHIHVAEQTAEVDDCLKATGMRPIEWLANKTGLDSRWHLVHATHTTPSDIQAVARSKANLIICPTTEANLGDGLADLPAWLAAKTPLSIGSDSHASRDALEEFRWLEYGQRLHWRKRIISGQHHPTESSCAATLIQSSHASGAQCAGLNAWGLTVGARADALVLDLTQPNLLGVDSQHWLDAAVFSSPSRPWRDVLVNGQWVVQNGAHRHQATIAAEFTRVMHELWKSAPLVG